MRTCQWCMKFTCAIYIQRYLWSTWFTYVSKWVIHIPCGFPLWKIQEAFAFICSHLCPSRKEHLCFCEEEGKKEEYIDNCSGFMTFPFYHALLTTSVLQPKGRGTFSRFPAVPLVFHWEKSALLGCLVGATLPRGLPGPRLRGDRLGVSKEGRGQCQAQVGELAAGGAPFLWFFLCFCVSLRVFLVFSFESLSLFAAVKEVMLCFGGKRGFGLVLCVCGWLRKVQWMVEPCVASTSCYDISHS